MKSDEAFSINIGFIIFFSLGSMFAISGLANFLYMDLCWNYGHPIEAIVTNKSEFHGKSTSYRILLDYPAYAQIPLRAEVDVTPEFFSQTPNSSKITVKYFPILESKIVADPGEKWSQFFVGIFGMAALVAAKAFRNKYYAITKSEPIPLRQFFTTINSLQRRKQKNQ